MFCGQGAIVGGSCTLETEFLMTVVYLVIAYMIVYNNNIMMIIIIMIDFIKPLGMLMIFICILYTSPALQLLSIYDLKRSSDDV